MPERHPLEKVLAEPKVSCGDVWLDLAEVREGEGRHFVDAFLETEPNRLGEGFRPALFGRTGGHPLFTIELLRAMQGRGDLVRDEAGRWVTGPALDWEALPARVEGVIEERISRFGEELRELLTVASVEGETFTAQVVAGVQGIGERQLLGKLTRQLERRHRLLHGEIGAILEALYAGHTEAVAVQLARHYSEAGQGEKAVGYLLQARDRARALYAHQEAVEHYEKALKFLKDAGDLDRAARALMKLGLTHHTAFQFGRSRQAYDEGFALWQRAAVAEPVVPLPPASRALRLATYKKPATMDPTVDTSTGPREVLGQLYSGLVELGLELEIVPDIAQSWEIREGGRSYIFHLRDDARWSDGAPVTAHYFRAALLRLLDPTTDLVVAGQLNDIQGGQAFHEGRSQGPECVGVRVPDDGTLIVDLEGPAGYFLHVLARMYPVPRHVVEAHGEAWTESGNLVTNGPYRLEHWEPGRLMIFAHNLEYHGQFSGNVERVELSFTPTLESRNEVELYEAHEIDVVVPPEAEIVSRRQRYAGEYVTGPELSNYCQLFDASRPPFDDRRVRQALVMAVDKGALTDTLFGGHIPPASGGFAPPGMPGHSPGIGLPYDPERARQLLAEAGYPGGRGFPTVEGLTRCGPSELMAEHQRVQWRQRLGIVVTWEAVDWKVLRERHFLGALPQMSHSGWIADYPDPDSFMRVIAADAQIRLKWQHEEYDRLVERARRVMDHVQRMELYRQADRILIEEASIAPMWYGRSHLPVKPWVRRFPRSAIREWFWKDVVLEPH